MSERRGERESESERVREREREGGGSVPKTIQLIFILFCGLVHFLNNVFFANELY